MTKIKSSAERQQWTFDALYSRLCQNPLLSQRHTSTDDLQHQLKYQWTFTLHTPGANHTHFFGGGGGGFFLGGEGGGGGFFFVGDDDGGGGFRGGGDDEELSPSSVALTAASHESSVRSSRVSFSLTLASL